MNVKEAARAAKSYIADIYSDSLRDETKIYLILDLKRSKLTISLIHGR